MGGSASGSSQICRHECKLTTGVQMIDPDISPETAAKYGNQSWENFKKIMQRTRRTTNSAEARPAAAKRSTSKRVLAIEEDSQPKRTEAGRNERALKAEA